MKGHGLIGITVLLLGACAYHSGPGNTLRFDSEALPIDIKLRAQVHYALPEGCEAQRRELIREFNVPLERRTFRHRLDVPMYRQAGNCQGRLVGLGLRVDGHYGPTERQEISAFGDLLLVEQLPAGTPGSDADGVQPEQVQCGWRVHLNSATSQQGEVFKLLHCIAAESFFQGFKINGRTCTVSPSCPRL